MYTWQRFSPIPKSSSSMLLFPLLCKVFSLMQSHLSILTHTFWAIRVLFSNLLLMPIFSSVFYIFSCSHFRVLGLTLQSSIHFELILTQGERQGGNLVSAFYLWKSSFPSTIFWRVFIYLFIFRAW
jgi:hypothetical protein